MTLTDHSTTVIRARQDLPASRRRADRYIKMVEESRREREDIETRLADAERQMARRRGGFLSSVFRRF